MIRDIEQRVRDLARELGRSETEIVETLYYEGFRLLSEGDIAMEGKTSLVDVLREGTEDRRRALLALDQLSRNVNLLKRIAENRATLMSNIVLQLQRHHGLGKKFPEIESDLGLRNRVGVIDTKGRAYLKPKIKGEDGDAPDVPTRAR